MPETRTGRPPNLAQPWAPHRRRIYLAVAAWTSIVFVAMTVGVAAGLIELVEDDTRAGAIMRVTVRGGRDYAR